MAKPNIVLFISDEEAYPFAHESPELKEWRHNNLSMYKFFKENAVEFT